MDREDKQKVVFKTASVAAGALSILKYMNFLNFNHDLFLYGALISTSMSEIIYSVQKKERNFEMNEFDAFIEDLKRNGTQIPLNIAFFVCFIYFLKNKGYNMNTNDILRYTIVYAGLHLFIDQTIDFLYI